MKENQLSDSILALNPGRVIFNPGAESRKLEVLLTEHQIPCINACTLVMLQSGAF